MSDSESYEEESMNTQFETTLTIRPSGPEDHDQQNLESDDVSMNYTIQLLRDLTMDDKNYVNDSDNFTDDDTPSYSLHLSRSKKGPKFNAKASRRLSLKDPEKKSPRSKLLLPTPIDPKYEALLEPSLLIDPSLDRYHATFDAFLAYNPHIESQLPRFENESKKTLVLLSPYSAEHAFGRSWVTKSYLATIFERPQRLLASCIGVAAAVTMYPFFYKVQNSEKRASMFSSYVRKVHGRHWPKKLYSLCLELYDKLLEDKLEVPEDWNTGDIYLTPKTINAVEGVLGTIESGIDALFDKKQPQNRHDLAFVVIRPPGHHSHACLPSGFCLLNNVQCGIEYAFETYGVTHCAILDIDLHHGDGSQDICWDRAGFMGEYGKEDEEDEIAHNPRDAFGKRFAQYPKVGYFSLHDIKSYPTELGYATKENIKNASTCVMAHDLNIWNVHLQQWKTEEEFYRHYHTRYVNILNRANQFLNESKKSYDQLWQNYLANTKVYQKYLDRPAAFNEPVEKPQPPPPFKPLIAISAGFDALEYENPQMQRHGVNVPTSFYATFTRDAVKLAKIHTKGRLISFLEGGYSDGALSTGIFLHLIGLTNAPPSIQKESDIEKKKEKKKGLSPKREDVDDDRRISDEEGEEVAWNESWGSLPVMKELVRGCKKNWAPYKQPNSEVRIWANEVIKLGRSMMPNAVLPMNHVYKAAEAGKKKLNSMMKSIEDNRHETADVGVLDRRVLRSRK